MTLRTVPFKIMPGFRSFISRTSLRRIGAGMLSLGSLEGFSNSLRMSVKVISPIPSSTASLLLSLIFFSRLLIALTVLAADSFCAGFFAEESFSSRFMTEPPIAAARAFPIAVLVLWITICFLRSFRLFCFGAGFAAVLSCLAACFCAVRTSSIVSPILSRSFMAAS